MVRCPKCGYILVLLEGRRRYGCAKCSRLFFQKLIESKTFRNWNKAQRETDLHNFNFELKQRKTRKKLTEQEKLQKRKEYYLKNKAKFIAKDKERYWKNHEKELERGRIYRENNKEKELERGRIYRENNKEKRILYTKKWVEENKERYKQWLKSHINKNKVKYKQIKRLGYWRLKQKELALLMLENEVFRAYNIKI